MGVVGRLNQYASMLATDFDEISVQKFSISIGGTCYSNEFIENVGIPYISNIYPAYNIRDGLIAEVSSGIGLSYPNPTLSANVFAPYDIVYDEFAGVSYGPGKGTFMRKDYIGDLIVYNEIDEISDFRDIVKNGLILDLDAGMNSSFNNTGTTWNDLSGRGNNGTLINGPTYSSEDGGYIGFTSTSSNYVTVNNNASILSKTAYTKIAWFYITSFSTQNNIISGSSSNSQHAFWLSGGNSLYSGHNASLATTVSSTTILSLNTWYCGAVTFNNTSGWNLYLNGVLENTNASTTTFTGDGRIFIGSYGAASNLLSGRISNVQVYDGALSAAEVSQNFNAIRNRFGL